MRILLSLILFFIACNIVTAQPLRQSSVQMKIERAYAAAEEGNYYGALDLFQEVYRETKIRDFLVDMAMLNYRLRDFKRAARYYERVLERDTENNYIDLRYEYGRLLKMEGDYKNAWDQLDFFIKYTTNDSLKDLAQKETLGMEMWRDAEAPLDLVIKNIGDEINSKQTDQSPYISPENVLYFGSFQKNSVIKPDPEAENEDTHLSIYRATTDEEGKYEEPVILNNQINREGYHTGNVHLSEDGNTMFFTRARISGNKLLESTIYTTERSGNEWSVPRAVSGINEEYLATHPAPGELFGNRVLYFVSQRPGSRGGYDIYYATHEGGNVYKNPVNLGEVINTKGDEMTPFYKDGALYFSSTGQPGMGGLDIYKSVWDGSSWSKPENLGAGYNTTYDDFYYRMHQAEKGVLVSNRPNPSSASLRSPTCCDDIYSVTIEPVVLELLVATFSDGDPLLAANISLVELREGQPVNETSKTSKGNAYKFRLDPDKKYKLLIEKEGYLNDSFFVNTVGLAEKQTIKKEVHMTPEEPEIQVITINEPIRLNNIYYEFDDAEILPEAEEDLRYILRLMNEYPQIKIELSSHTDARGNDAYNQQLSQRRANNAKEWLVQRGMDPVRVKAVGYGETQILNRCINGVECTEEEHKFNRRTEFKIIEGPQTIEVQKEVIRGNDQKTGVVPDQLPDIEFKSTFHDLGLIRMGEKPSFSFPFTNTGETDLVIEMASACDCTDLEWPVLPVKPGETAEIKVVYNTPKLKEIGEQEVSIDVLANTDPIIHELRFRAFVEQ